MPEPPLNTLYYGDCLDVMQEWPPDCIDFVYLDPPFNSNVNYNVLFRNAPAPRNSGASRRIRAGAGREAQVVAFEDTWAWDDEAAIRVRDLRNATGHRAHRAISGLFNILGESGMMAYLSYMALRLAEIQRVVKPTGNIFLHCDDTASHYLKVLMDGIFGAAQFQNNLVWRRARSHNDARRFGRILDDILFYCNGAEGYWNEEAAIDPRSEGELEELYDEGPDERGSYYSDNLTGAGRSGGESGRPWRGYDIDDRGRHWSPPRTSHYARYIDEHIIPGYLQIEGVHARLDALDDAGMVDHPKGGFWPQLKRYRSADRGRPYQSLILDPPGFNMWNARRGEYLGYPTQKPMALLDRLLAAACPEGGVAFDPFCGCGTTIAAAHTRGIDWIGVDVSPFAVELIISRRFPGTPINTRGIPTSMEGAAKLAAEQPFEFEKWAVSLIPGMLPNQKQRGDGGTDGIGALLDVPADAPSAIVRAQVKGGRHNLGDIRDFCDVIEHEEAAMGIFITLEPVTSRRARALAGEMGTVAAGADEFPRLQLWSIADYFQNRRPKLPPLADPYTGRQMAAEMRMAI